MAMGALGWSDVDVYALLECFRTHLRHYIYASMDDFAAAVHAELPGKRVKEIQEMVRALMVEFGLVLSTKNFRKDVLRVEGKEVWVYEHLYKSISELAENKAGGGVWLPDELSRFFLKAKQYRKLFQPSQDTYFSRIQIWGKSVAETKSKFYALRDMYMKEKKVLVLIPPRTNVDATRLELMKALFDKVPPAPREEKSDVSVPKKQPNLWTPTDLEILLNFLVHITRDVQTTGYSELVSHVSKGLRRTEQSCYHKLQDMHARYIKKTPSYRAAQLPDSIYEPNSEAHKIFNADWDDRNDPYAVGYFAFRSHCNKALAEIYRHRKKNVLGIHPPRRNLRPKNRETSASETRPPARSTAATSQKTTASPGRSLSNETPSSGASDRHARMGDLKRTSIAESITTSLHTKAQTQALFVEEKPPAVPLMRAGATDYDKFVHEMALLCNWSEKVTLGVLRAMKECTDVYQTGDYGRFWKKVAGLTSGSTIAGLWANGPQILQLYNMCFGPLGGPKGLKPSERNAEEDMSATTSELAGQEQGRTFEPLDDDTEQAVRSPEGENEQGKSDDDATVVIGDDEDRDDSIERGSPVEHHGGADVEDAEATPSVVGAKSSPEDSKWGADDDAADCDADVDDDGLDIQSVDSSNNAWSGSSYTFDSKNDREVKDDGGATMLDSKKGAKRGKNDNYGKSFALAKKRRLQAQTAFVSKYEEDDEEENEDDEDQSLADEEVDDELPEDSDSSDSDNEQEKDPHPLQDLLNSLGAHIAELETKNRALVAQKEARERHQRHFPPPRSEFRVEMAPYVSGI